MKRSTAVALIAAGTIGVSAYALTERRDCQRDISGNLPPGCSSSSGSSSRSSGGGSAFYGGSTSTSTSSPASTSTARSGFGSTGAAHGAGS